MFVLSNTLFPISVLSLQRVKNHAKQANHNIDPQGRPTVKITIFTHVCPFVRLHNRILAKKTKKELKIMITSGGTVGLAVGIMGSLC